MRYTAGVAAVIDPGLRPDRWPDFMDKVSRPAVFDSTLILMIQDGTKKRTYKSQKVLGKLFRIVRLA